MLAQVIQIYGVENQHAHASDWMLQVDKMSQATKRSYADPSQASSDPDGAVSTTSSLPNADRSVDIPS